MPDAWVSGPSVPSPGKDDRINTDRKADTLRPGLDCPRKDPMAQRALHLFQTCLGFLFDTKVNVGRRATYAADGGCRLLIGGPGGNSAGL